MQSAQHAQTKARSNRRRQQRFAVDENAVLILVNHGSSLAARLEDLSLGGCRLRLEKRFLAGTLVRVEVILQVRGSSLRIPGVTQWTDGKFLAGIRFVDMTQRRIDALAELIGDAQVNMQMKNAAGDGI
jgi:PilZ domain